MITLFNCYLPLWLLHSWCGCWSGVAGVFWVQGFIGGVSGQCEAGGRGWSQVTVGESGKLVAEEVAALVDGAPFL
jgi:hypothetical protein